MTEHEHNEVPTATFVDAEDTKDYAPEHEQVVEAEHAEQPSAENLGDNIVKAATEAAYAAVGFAGFVGEKARSFYEEQQRQYVAAHPDSATALAMVRDGRNEVALYRADAEAAMEGKAQWTPVADFEDVVVEFALSGDGLYLLSKKEASGGRVLQTSATTPDLAAASAIALPGEPVIESILPTREGLLVRTIDGASSGLWRVPAGGVAGQLALPAIATVMMWHMHGGSERVAAEAGSSSPRR